MLNKCEFHNADGTHVFAFNDVTSPLNDFDITTASRVSTDRKKSQRHGVNPTRPLRDGMQIHIEGAMFQDTTDLYTAYRKTMTYALFGDPNDTIDATLRKNGTLVINLDGEIEDWQTDCVISAYTNPIKANYPTLSEFMVEFFSWDAWFTGVDTGIYYYWS